MEDCIKPECGVSWQQPPWLDDDLVPGLGAAREVLSLTDNPSEDELVEVNHETTSSTPLTLGFDVGYWGRRGTLATQRPGAVPLAASAPRRQLELSRPHLD